MTTFGFLEFYLPNNEKKINKILLFFIYFIPIALLSGSFVINFFIIFINFFFILIIIREKNYRILKDKYILSITFFFFFIVCNLLFFINIFNSIPKTLGFIRFIILALAIKYCFQLNKSKYQNKILSIWTIIFLIVSFDLIFETITGFNILGYKSYMQGRLSSFLGHDLKIGGFYHGFMLITVAFIFFRSPNLLGFLSIIAFATIILLIGERSNLLKALTSLTLFFLFFKEKFLIKKKIFTIILIFILFFLVLTNFESKKGRYNDVYNHVIKHGLITSLYQSHNFAHVYTAYKIFLNYPVFGIGINNFRYECAKEIYKYEKLSYSQGRCSTHPHQYFFEMLSETGIVGTLLFVVVFLYILLGNFITYLKNKNLIQLACLSFLASSLIPFFPSGSFFTTYNATIFWLNIGIILSFKKSSLINSNQRL